MIAVFDGNELKTIETGPTSKDVFKSIRQGLDGGFAEPINPLYASKSGTFSILEKSNIKAFADEQGTGKELPLTWRNDEFSILGPIVFSGYDETTRRFTALTEEQLSLIRQVMLDQAPE